MHPRGAIRLATAAACACLATGAAAVDDTDVPVPPAWLERPLATRSSWMTLMDEFERQRREIECTLEWGRFLGDTRRPGAELCWWEGEARLCVRARLVDRGRNEWTAALSFTHGVRSKCEEEP